MKTPHIYTKPTHSIQTQVHEHTEHIQTQMHTHTHIGMQYLRSPTTTPNKAIEPGVLAQKAYIAKAET